MAGLSKFRISTEAATAKSSSKGPRGNWRDRFTWNEDGSDSFIFVNGEYVDPDPSPEQIDIDPKTGQQQPVLVEYYKWLQHKAKVSGRQWPADAPCARGWDKHSPKPCAACQSKELGESRIDLKTRFSFTVVHLAPYHRHPQIDKKGQIVMKKDNSGPYMTETACSGPQTCNFCRTATGQIPILKKPNEMWPHFNPADLSVIFGARRYLDVGSGHLNDIVTWEVQTLGHCGGTAYVRNPDGSYMLNQQGYGIPKGRCNNKLTITDYKCSSCNNVLLANVQTDPRGPKMLEDIAKRKFQCPHCQRQVMLAEVVACNAGCSGAVSDSIFDVVVTAAKQGEGTQSHLVLQGVNNIDAFEAEMNPNVRALIKGSLRDRIKELAIPFDFTEIHKPLEFAEMCERLEITNVHPPQTVGGYQQAPQQPYAQQTPYGQNPYGQNPQGGYQQPQQPQYTPYPPQQTGSPQPPPFVPPTKPNFGS
jgi:DNA-directed RNA polymerase subunit RPC12/RpoP